MVSWNAPDYAPDANARRSGGARRHPVAFVASIAVHALMLAALVFLLPQKQRPHQWVMAYLIDMGGSGSMGSGRGGSGGAAASPPGAPAHDAASAAMPPKPHLPHHRAARPQAMPARASLPHPAAIAATPASGDAAIAAIGKPAVPASAGTAGNGLEVALVSSSAPGLFESGVGGGGGTGLGGNGDGPGTGSAHAEYGQNPGPSYPIEARRRAEQGTVVLRVEVGADGSVERVEVAHSSGFDALDDSAIETVRARWRFVPARRDGVAIESWVQVPIRFALTEASTN